MPRWNDDDRTMLAKIRAQSGFSMEKAAALMGITSRTLARYENGVNDVPMGIAEQMTTIYKVPFENVRQAVIATKTTTQKSKEMNI